MQSSIVPTAALSAANRDERSSNLNFNLLTPSPKTANWGQKTQNIQAQLNMVVT